MTFELPQILYLMYCAFTLTRSMIWHGKPIPEGRAEGFATSIVLLTVFWAGGFFETFGWPQVIFLILLTAAWTILSLDEVRREKYSVYSVAISLSIVNTLLYFGGFYG